MRLTHITTTAIVLALGIATASAAAARDSGTTPAVLPNPDQQQVTEQPRPAPLLPAANPTVGPNPDQQYPANTTPAVIVRTSAAKNEFDWGDAGIGAGGALGLAAIGLAGALTVTQRRTRRVRRSASATG